MSQDPDLKPSTPADGLCNESDGFSSCTEHPGHVPPHYDTRTQHEWADDEFLGEQRSGNLFDQAF
jgi:hypothetical protein